MTRTFDDLYADYYTAVRNYLSHHIGGDWHTAEDLTQATFLSAWRYWHSFQDYGDGGKGWLLTIAKRKYIDWTRRRTRTDRSLEHGVASDRTHNGEQFIDYSEHIMDDGLEDEAGICERLDTIANLAQFQAYLAKCPELVAHAAGATSPEIAERFGITEVNARVRIHRQRVKLARLLAATQEAA